MREMYRQNDNTMKTYMDGEIEIQTSLIVSIPTILIFLSVKPKPSTINIVIFYKKKKIEVKSTLSSKLLFSEEYTLSLIVDPSLNLHLFAS